MERQLEEAYCLHPFGFVEELPHTFGTKERIRIRETGKALPHDFLPPYFHLTWRDVDESFEIRDTKDTVQVQSRKHKELETTKKFSIIPLRPPNIFIVSRLPRSSYFPPNPTQKRKGTLEKGKRKWQWLIWPIKEILLERKDIEDLWELIICQIEWLSPHVSHLRKRQEPLISSQNSFRKCDNNLWGFIS